jgi:PAS domain S-box-containing protein
MLDGDLNTENEHSTQNVADGVILGQLMAAQNLLFVLPNKSNIASYYASLLVSVPGVRSCRVCLGNFFSKDGGFVDDACSSCPNRNGMVGEFSTISKDAECQYTHQPSITTIPLETSDFRFGTFVLEIDQPELFERYKPFICNLGNFLAVTLESRLHKNKLEIANKSLEAKVEERTKQLKSLNINLEEEIKERIQLTENLQNSEDMFHFLFNTMVQGVVIQDETSKIIGANDAAGRILGLSMDQMLGKTTYDPSWSLIHEDGTILTPSEMPSNIALRTGKTVSNKLLGASIPELDLYHWILVSSTPKFKSGERTPYLTMTTFMDITDLKKTKESLAMLNRELMAISNCNQVLVRADEEQTLLNEICRIICDEAGYRLAWVGVAENDASKTVRPIASYGYDEGYTTIANISWDERSERGHSMAGRAIRSGKSIYSQDLENEPLFTPWSEEASKRGFKSGIALPMKNSDGVVIGALMIYSTEKEAITKEEVRLLEELAGDLAFGIASLRIREEKKLALDALQKSEAHFHSLFDRVNDGVYRSTHEGKFVDINPAMVEMFGYSSKQEMLEIDIRKELYFAPEERDEPVDTINLDNTDIFRMRRKDGSEIWVEDNGRYEKDEHGNTTFHEGILRDVTKRKKMEDELIKAKENAELSDRLKTEFLQNISHEIRTPMNAISGFSRILNTSDLSPEEMNKYSGIVQSNIDQLLSIINDIITISCIETNQETLEVQLTSLNDIMNEMYHLFNDRFQLCNCVLIVDKTLNDAQSLIHTDGTKLSRILNNLLSNALKFTIDGTVKFGYRLLNNHLEFYVKDSGSGIEPELQDKIFDHFWKANMGSTFTKNGTGLGLSISKGFVELLGGKIWVESEVNKGSTIYFTIPYDPAY